MSRARAGAVRTGTVAVRAVGHLINLGAAAGIRRDTLLGAADVSDEDLDNPDARVPLVAEVALWQMLATHISDPEFGIRAGGTYSLRTIGLVGYVARFSNTLRGALLRVQRYGRMFTEAVEFHLQGSQVALVRAHPAVGRGHALAESYRLAAVLRTARELTGVEIVPTKVVCTHAQPLSTTAHRELFRCPLHFDAHTARIVFRTVDLERRAIGQLAGGIAHDFNNLLVVINGYAELIAQELEPAHRSQRDLDQIRVAAASAANLTRQLLAFSRRQILQLQVLDPNQVLRRMERLLDRAIGEHITLVMNLAAAGRVTADPGQMEQVILNLAVNARDAMPNGGRLIIETADAELDAGSVERYRGARVGKHVLITVTDTGTGMDEETRAHLFEPFFTTKGEGRGTGLGLATVYGIVKQSGGSIWVDSEPGKGSAFKIYLPVATGAIEASAPSIEPQDLRGTETVLVVEDQPEVRALIASTLTRHGYSVLVAGDGREGLAAARADDRHIHLMLTDVVLPGTGGREVARQLCADRPSLRVLYMSGYTEDAIHHHGVLEPGLAYIQKPFTADALVRKIREVLDADQPPRF